MPFSTLKLLPGVKAELTPVLNQAGISSANLVRFPQGLPEKIGGWSAWYSFPLTAAARVLHAWEDLSGVSRLALAGGTPNFGVVTNGVLTDLTPALITYSVAPNFSTTSGSTTVSVGVTGSNSTTYDVLIFETPVSVGGAVLGLNGAYSVAKSTGPDAFDITAASAATSTVSGGGVVPTFSTTVGSYTVTCVFPNHGLSVGSSFPINLSTVVGGITLFGLYTVASVTDANTFTFFSQNQASSAQTNIAMNGGNVSIAYWVTATQPLPGTGYGVGGYGEGGYGDGVPPPAHYGTPINAADYCLDNWGEDILCSPKGYGIFRWAPSEGLRGTQLLAAGPTICTGFFVAMPEQQIIAYGVSVLGVQDPLLIGWCGVGDYTVWTAALTNQAGTFRLPRGSMIVGGMQGPQQGLLWTDLAIWSIQYIGYPLVYSFSEIANGCGLIAQHAACVLGPSVYWMSQRGFFVLAGGAVQSLPCDVWDVIFQNLSSANVWKIRAGANSQFNEVTWFFPSASGSGENDTYVKFNTATSAWDYGSLERTAWINQSVLGAPIGCGPGSGGSTYLLQHETSTDAAGSAIDSWFETGFFMLSDGEDKVFVDYMIPDFKYGGYGATQSAALSVTVYLCDYPEQTPTVLGPYTINAETTAISLRARARFISLRFEGDDVGSWWRLGGVKFRFAPDGRN